MKNAIPSLNWTKDLSDQSQRSEIQTEQIHDLIGSFIENKTLTPECLDSIRLDLMGTVTVAVIALVW